MTYRSGSSLLRQTLQKRSLHTVTLKHFGVVLKEINTLSKESWKWVSWLPHKNEVLFTLHLPQTCKCESN